MNDSDFTTGQIKPIECYKEGWEIIKNDYWILFLIAFVGALIGGFSLYILLGAMVCGIFFCFLQKIDTGTVSFDNLWKGFDYFFPSLIVTLFIIVPMIVVYAIIYIPFIIFAVMGQKLSSEEFMSMFVRRLAVDAVIVFIMVCFHTLLMFSFPLIVDRKLSALESIKRVLKLLWQIKAV